LSQTKAIKLKLTLLFEDALSRIMERGGNVTRSVPLVTLKDVTADPKGVSVIEEFFGEEIQCLIP